MPQLLKVIKPFTALFFNSLIFFVSIFLLAKATSLTHILLLAYPLGFGAGCAAPIVNGYMVQNMPANKSGTANGIFYSCLDSGFGIGGLIWGLVAASYGYRSMFLMTAYIQILSLVICAWVLLQEKRSVSLELVK